MDSTIANYQGNGSTTDFSVPFDYLAKKFVKVTVDSREKLGVTMVTPLKTTSL